MPELHRPIKEKHKKEIFGIILLALSVLCLISLWFADSGNPILTNKGIGTAGQFLVRVLSGFAGKGRYLLPILMVFMGIRTVFRQHDSSLRTIGAFQMFIVILTVFHLATFSTLSPMESVLEGTGGKGGGLLGAVVAVILHFFFGIVGSYVILSALALISLLLITDVSLFELIHNFKEFFKSCYSGFKREITNFLFTVDDGEGDSPHPGFYKFQKKSLKQKNIENNHLTSATEEETLVKESQEITSKTQGDEEEKFEERDKGSAKNNYLLPPNNLLKRPSRPKKPRFNKDIAENVRLLEKTLQSFGVEAKVTQVDQGPSITRYEVQPAPGTKVNKIINLSNDIALSLAALDVRIEAPIPGKAAVGIEVPNKEIATVNFREILETPEFRNSPSKLTIALGKDLAGNAIITDLSKMPHLLIAGTTGSGKSVCLNVLITSLLFKCKPEELKLLLIDPKVVEFTNYNGIPHLISPVVTDAKKAAIALQWMVNEMERRYELFAANGVKDIVKYNYLDREEKPKTDFLALPYIIVIIDELAELMQITPADVEDSICRLAQMARAAGIHLVVATQRPSVNVITGVIKANIPSRIAFMVSSQTDSRTILDSGGAEKLLGRGDMLFYPVGASKAIRLQGAYISDKEVEAVVDYLQKQSKPKYEKDFSVVKQQQASEEEEDELLPEAVRIFLESGQASISLLQRRLRIGYTRAARLIDVMEKKNIVGSYEGSKPRSLLISWKDYEKFLGKGVK